MWGGIGNAHLSKKKREEKWAVRLSRPPEILWGEKAWQISGTVREYGPGQDQMKDWDTGQSAPERGKVTPKIICEPHPDCFYPGLELISNGQGN